MRRLSALLLLLAFVFSAYPVHAQSPVTMDLVEVQIWPEYDKPSVLVIYYITLAPETTLPASVTIRIPAAAGAPTALAVGKDLGSVADQGVQFNTVKNGDWMDVVIQATGPAIQLEYYDPSITVNGTSRSFVYQWPGDYPVKDLSIKLQQPFDASNVQADPALPDVSVQANGLTYHAKDFGVFPSGQVFSLKVNYQKASDALTVSNMPVQSSAPVTQNTAGRVSFQTYLPWLLGGFGVLLIAGGLYYYFRSSGTNTRPTRRRHVARETSADSETYCHQCGTRARPGDRFCRTCGSRLRGAEAEED